MSNITGGELSYVISVDTKQLKTQLKDGEKTLMGFNDVAEKAGESLDKMVDGNILKNLKSMGIEIGKTGSELKKALKDADEFVGGMESGLKIVVAEHAKLLAEINKMPEGGARNQLLEEYRAEGVEIKKVSQQITQYKEFLSSVKEESKSLTSKLKEVTNEMKVLSNRGEENSQRYQELTQKAAEYRDVQDAVNKQVQIASDPQGLNGLISTLTFAAGGFSAVQGAMGLFGGESEDLNKIMLKVQSSLALVVGLQEIQKQVSAEGAFNITVLSRIKQIWAATNLRVATTLGISTVAAQALTATLTLGLSVAVIAIIALFQKWQTESDKLAEKNKQITSSLADSVAEPLYQYKRLQLQWNNLGDDLNKKKKFIDENKDSFNKLGVEVGNVSEAERILVSESDTFIEMMMLRAEAAAYAQSAMDSFKKSLELRGEANEKLNNPTIGQNIGAFWQMGVLGKSTDEYIAGAYQESDAEKQKALDFTTKQVELMQKADEIANKNGWKKPDEKKGKTKNAQQVADEYLPEGSVAEIRKRLSQIDEELSKATGKEQISKLKTERINTAIELAKAEKLIQTQSITDQVSESKTLWEQYYNAVNSIGKAKADELYSDLIKKDKTQFDALVRQRDELVAKGNLNDEERTVLGVLNNEIDKLLGQKSQLDQFKEKTEKTLSNLATISEKIAYLDSLKNSETNTQTSLGIGAYITEETDKYRSELKTTYQEFLKDHQSFEERRLKISEQYKILREQNEADYKSGNIDEKQYEINKNKIDVANNADNSALEIDIIKQSKEWEVAFGDMELMTTTSLQRILATLIDFREKSKGTLTLTDAAELERAIERVRSAANQNPFSQIVANLREYRIALKAASTSTKEIEKAQQNYNRTLDKEGKETAASVQAKQKLKQATEKGIETDIKAAEAKKKLIGNLQKGQDIFNAVGEGIMQLGDAFGGFDDATNDAIGDIMAIGNAAFDLGKSISSGDVAGMIKAGVQLIGSVFSALSGDKKKERQIKAWADQVANLKIQYQELERAMNKALGDDKYKNQQEQIANLEKQKNLLQQMIRKEKEKKKSDKGKIKDWQQQISDINSQIDDLKKSIIDDILQIDVKGLADKIGDALVEGFGRGEDALDSLNKTADEVFKEMVKNALNMELEKRMQPIIDNMLKAMGYGNNDDAINKQIQELEKQREALSDNGGLGSPFANASQIVSITKRIAELKAKLGQTTGSFDGLTEEEREAIKAQIVAATGDYQKAMEQYADLFGPDAANNPNGLEGDIKGITEKTAGALESQINAIRIYQVESLNTQKANQNLLADSLKNLVMIEYNTRMLHVISRDIAELNSKVSKPLAGLSN